MSETTDRHGVTAGDDPTLVARLTVGEMNQVVSNIAGDYDGPRLAKDVARIVASRVDRVAAERDAARAEVAALRERVEALADKWEADCLNTDIGKPDAAYLLRAALAEAVPDHDGSAR